MLCTVILYQMFILYDFEVLKLQNNQALCDFRILVMI